MHGLNTWNILCFLFCFFSLSYTASSEYELLEIRLTGGSVPSEGRLQVYYNGKWGPVCDAEWSIEDADVVCRTLGYTNSMPNISENAYSHDSVEGSGSSDFILDNDFSDNVRCNGTETHISFCPYTSSSFHNCSQDRGVQVACRGIDEIRLLGSTSPREGRVEVFQRNSWGTVCDNNFDHREANVVCRMLGFAFAERYYSSEKFGAGTGNVHVTDIDCTGNEVNINQCSPRATSPNNCTHDRDVGVTCAALPVRLVDGSSPNEGRVEVYFEGSWGTICDDDWNGKSGNVVCRMLGYPGVRRTYVLSYFGEGSGLIVLDSTRCDGWESHIARCSHDGYTEHNCDHSEDSGVVCSGEASTQVRLRDGPDPSQGRLELYLFGAWGTACKRNWTSIDSSVVCRKLGYFGATDTLSGPLSYVPGAGMVLLQEPRCQGKESDLLQCDPAYPLGVTNCTHDEDVWVSCLQRDNLRVRLVGGHSSSEGRVEVFHRGKWGTICDDNWNMLDSNVVCRMLGYDAAEDYSCCARYGKGSGDILLDEVQCNGTEHNIGHCMRQDYRVHDCDHSEDVGVSCISYDATVSFQSPLPKMITKAPLWESSPLWLITTGAAVVFFVLFLISVSCFAYARKRALHYRERAAQAKRDLHLQPLSRKEECSNSYAKSFTGSCRESCRESTEARPALPSRDYGCRGTTEPQAAAANGHTMISKPMAVEVEVEGTEKQVQKVHSEAPRPESPYQQTYESPLEIYEVPEDYEDVMVATCKTNF